MQLLACLTTHFKVTGGKIVPIDKGKDCTRGLYEARPSFTLYASLYLNPLQAMF